MSDADNHADARAHEPRGSGSESEGADVSITLQRLLKVMGLVASGGEAKVRIQGGEARVNGEVETRRRRKLYSGDVVAFEELEVVVDLEPDDGEDGDEGGA